MTNMLPLQRFIKTIFSIVLLMLFSLTKVFSQTAFQPLTHVSAFYMNGECEGKIKFKFLFQEKDPQQELTNFTLYYLKPSTNTWISIAVVNNNHNNAIDWTETWWGAIRYYSLSGQNGANITNGNFINEGGLRFKDFVWNNVPADAYGTSGVITLASAGSFGFSTWQHTTSSSRIIVPLPVLNAPGTVAATNGTHCDKVAITWSTPGSFPCSYAQEVYRDNVRIATISGSATSYDDAAAPQGPVTYYVKAAHTTTTNNGLISSYASNTVIGSRNASALPPSGINATTTRCDGKISVSWSFTGNNPPNFRIFRSTASNGTYTQIAEVGGGERSYTDNSVPNANLYYYKVATVGTCGESMSGTYYEGQAPAAPAKPTNVAAVTNGSSGFNISWTDNSNNETGFIVERTIQGAPGSTLFNVDANQTSYVDNSVLACVNYIYTVKSFNNCQPGGNASLVNPTVRIFPNISNSFDATHKLKCSKGYFTNMVQLEWGSNDIDIINQYRIYRKTYGATGDSTLIGTASMGDGSFIDNNAISGILYKYTVIGVLNCAGFTRFTNHTEDIGFRTAFGTVSGSIAYQGGFALQHAKVMVTPSAASFIGASINFPNTNGRLTVPSSSKLDFDNGVTLETWFRAANTTGNKELITLTAGTKTISIGLSGANLKFDLNNGSTIRTYTSGLTYLANNYNQATAVVRNDSMIVYLNGIRAGGLSLSGYTIFPLANASVSMANGFVGNIDEVRIYNRAKTLTQAMEDYSRRVDPDDDGLLCYYTFDENITNYNGFFDYSRVGNVFNEHHGTILNGNFSNIIPSTSQLAYASYTDATGSYVVTNIGYQSGGQVFSITPSFETHSFTPINRTAFIGEGAAVHNQQDFTDISSFPVSGTVMYANTSCPAEGIYLKIDGVRVVRNGEPITTDQLGAFNIEMPIGKHVITVEKTGHVFSQGRFPSTGEFNFQNAVANIQFIDSTLIKVVGRAVGGAIEANKKPGLGKSINNIGVTRIAFKSQLGNGCKTVSITTNDSTGEYVAYLPPLVYTVDTVKVLSNPIVNFGTQAILDLTNATTRESAYDTTYITGSLQVARIDSVSFNKRRDFIFYTSPELYFARTVAKTPTDSAFVGETRIDLDTVNFISLVPNNPFTYPVFRQFKPYTAKVYAYDVYVNRDRIPNVQFKVPLDGYLLINNALASAEGAVQQIEMKGGVATYTFRGGGPDLTTNNSNPAFSFTKTLTANFYTSGTGGVRNVSWLPNPGNTPYRGYVFGGRGRGTNFLTNGPEKVDLILRDPPGSASSSTWAKNTTYNTIKRYSNLNNTNGSFMGTVHLGAKWEASVGLVFEISLENEIGGNAGFGVTKETTAGTNGELVESYSSNISLSTGSGPDQVGAKADILFGHSTNYALGIADNLMLVNAATCAIPGVICGTTDYNGYKIGIRSNLAVNPKGIQTVFAYTVGEVEDIVIPNLVKARNKTLATATKRNGQPRYTINFTNEDDPNYEKKFGANNDDPIWGASRNNNDFKVQDFADRTGPSYTFAPDSLFEVDSVRYYNNQIRLWKEALAKNEKEKYDAFELNIGNILNSGTNTSIGKATITREFSVTKSKEETSYEEVYLAHDETYGFRALAGGSGIELNGSLTLGETNTLDEGSSTDTTTTISYTLNDGDDGDLISVDIVDPGTGNGHLFRLRGGQTSCPYEGEVWANYYKPSDTIHASTYHEQGESVKLSSGTAKRHIPTIQVPQPVIFNVPADQAATFTIQLGNSSESEDDQDYSLRIIEVTNPNGAILTIDGLDPNRDFSIPYATNISKTLSVKRGPLYYDYDSILLVFKSPCDDDIADSAYISVHFIPTCTQPIVYIPGDKWTLNRSFKDTMNVIITGYDYNFGGFKDISFQYKPSSSSQWNILETFHKVPPLPIDKEIPTIQPYIEYAWNMRQMVDGPYDIRAVSTCAAPGHPDAKVESLVNRGLADRINPSPFGNPSPADGILSPNDEISIQFNELVDNASLTYSNFDIRGVLNGSATQNTASIYFDGNNDYVEVPTGLNLTKKSFSLEIWARRGSLGKQIMFSQGIDATQNMAIGFDENNKFFFSIGNETVRTNTAITDTNSFQHYTISYNFDNDQCELFVNGVVSNTGNTSIYSNYEGGGKTMIGMLSNSNNFFFKGNLRDLRLWSKTRNSAAILSSINRSLKGTESGIMANWRFDEATGLQAKDYIRSRHATIVNAVWEISPKGKSYRIVNEPLAVEAADIAFTGENDFTIEFWFKGNNVGGNVALFSNGKGDSTDQNPGIKWSIEKDASGKIFIKHMGLSFEAVSTNFFDGNWHHFAMVLQRATSLAVFIDGNQQNSTSSSSFKEFGGSKVWIGGRGYEPPVGPTVVDRTFNGYIDEVRVWSSARTQSQIDRDRVNRLAGTESDIVLYIPFELYTINMGVPILTASLSDIKSPGRVITGTNSSGSGLNEESPTIKLQRPVESINFTYAINNDKIILTPNTLPELIENVTLDITVKNVYDLNGNKMQSPKTWIAYVDKNQVKWQDQEFNFVKKRGEALTFTSNVVNSGGALKIFNIQNLPSWLSASPASGNVPPNSYRTVKFTVDPNANIGEYENEVQLLTDFGYPDNLLVRLKVFAEPPASWIVNPGAFQNAMSIVGQIRINNVISTNPDDKLGAFVNGQCRGIASLQYFSQIDRYYAFLNVYSNVSSGEQIEFKIWNASEGKIHSDVTPQIQFISNGQIGTISAPQVFNATDKLTSFIPLSTGWNWISFNLAMRDSNDLNALFRGLNSGTGDIFRSLTSLADYSALNGWVGALAGNSSGVKPEQSYRIRMSNLDTLVVNGVEIDPTTRPIKLDSGWNWIGFISQRNLSVTEAFSSLNASNGDLVKSQSQFALYDNNIGWVGSLTTMIPSKGYMYRSAANTVFAYPRSAMFGKTGVTENAYRSNFFNVDVAKYEKNMNAIVDAGVCNDVLTSGRFSLGAYADNQLRGATKVTTLSNGRNVFFITMLANNEQDNLTFKLLDEKTGTTYDLSGGLKFENNKLIGTISQPHTLTTSGNFNCNDFAQGKVNGLQIFAHPNPFNHNVVVNVQGLNASKLKVKVLDVTGKLVDEFEHNSSGQINTDIDWNPEERGINLKQGFYFVEVEGNNQTLRTKIIKY